MPAKKYGYTPLQTLRRAVAERVEATSVRTIAHEIGMSSSGLHSFLYGDTKRDPHPRTYQKLIRWYRAEALARKRRKPSSVSPELANIALAVLTQHIEIAQCEKAQAKLLDLIDDLSDDKIPKWLTQVRQAIDREPG